MMIKNLFKITLTAIILAAAPLAHAIEFGEYTLTPFDEARKNKAFNICIQPEGNWHISSGVDKGWWGKWSTGSEGDYIFQAISTPQKRMISFSTNDSISFGYYQEMTTKGSGTTMEVELTYKGRCVSQPGGQKQVKKPAAYKKSATQNPYTMQEKPPVGLWRLAAVYKNGKFEACAAALPGPAGNLIISQNAQEAWRLELPAVAQLKGHASAQVKERLGNMKEKTVSVSIDPDDDGLARDVSHGWVADFFAMAENEDYYTRGIVRDTYQVRLGAGLATTMKWNLTSQEDALMAIEACVQEAKKSKPAARGTPKFQPRAAAQNTNKFGIYTAILINRGIVKDVIVQGKDIYVKIPSGGNITVKKSAKYNGPYSKWYKSGLVKRLGVSNSNRGTNKKGYTYRINTNAKFIEYYVNGALVLHLVRE